MFSLKLLVFRVSGLEFRSRAQSLGCSGRV